MKETKRGPKSKVFGGKRYSLTGSSPTKSKKVAEDWAKFQREVNNLLARVVSVPGGYEVYIRRGKTGASRKISYSSQRITPKMPRISR